MKQFLSNLRLVFLFTFGLLLVGPTCMAQVNYFPKVGYANLLARPSSWTTCPFGTGCGSTCTGFTSGSAVFHVTNTGNATPTLDSNWTVSGTGSHINIGEGTTPAVNFTIPAAYKITGPIDSITAGATLTIISTATLPTIVWTGTVANVTSTIDFLNMGSVTNIPVSFTYGNVIFDGTKCANTAGGTFSLAGNFTMQNAGAGFVPAGAVGMNLTGTANQLLTGNNYEFHCNGNFLDSLKTAGNVTFSANTPINITNHILLRQTGPTNLLSDGGNSDTVGNNVDMDGVSTGYNLTGTIVLVGTSGTQKISNNYNNVTPGAIAGALNNLTIDCSNTVSFYTSNANQTITIKGNILILANSSPINFVTNSPATGLDTFKIGGNYTNNITTSPTYNPKTVYEFNGTVPQTLKTNVGGGETYPNMEVYNASGVTLNSPFNVSATFILARGLLNTATTDILTLTAAAVSTAGSTNSYVNGPMAKKGNTAFVFPVGGSGTFASIGMSAPQTATNDITAQFFLARPVNTTSINPALTNVSIDEYWTMSETVLTDSIHNISLYWQNGPAIGIFNYNNTLRVAEYNTTGTIWDDLGQSAITGTYPGAGNVTSSAGIKNFTNLPVTFGSTDIVVNPLPIILTSFGATYIGESNTVLVNWVVASQLNNKEFVIEKTSDGINYTEVTTTAGAGTTPFSVAYSVIDYYPTPGVSYYRLKQIDMDGSPTYFSPVSVIDGTEQNTSVSLFPNPVGEFATVSYISEDNTPLTISITDLSGRLVNSITYSQVLAGDNNFILNTSGLKKGIYLLRCTNGQKEYNLKFIKL